MNSDRAPSPNSSSVVPRPPSSKSPKLNRSPRSANPLPAFDMTAIESASRVKRSRNQVERVARNPADVRRKHERSLRDHPLGSRYSPSALWFQSSLKHVLRDLIPLSSPPPSTWGRNHRYTASRHVRRGKVGRRENDRRRSSKDKNPSALIMVMVMVIVDHGRARTVGMEIKSLRTGFLPSSPPVHLVKIIQHEPEFCWGHFTTWPTTERQEC